MRVSSCKCHRSFFCCSKPSPSKHRSPSPPKSEDGQDASSIPAPIAVALLGKSSDEKAVDEQTRAEEGKADVFLKSCLKKPAGSDSKEVEKGNVKWMDLLGKELVELKEFEPSESGEEDNVDENPACLCVIQ